MEKVCEFCKSLRPIVYCKADAAHLCLFCDMKVHSANTLSSRHPRTLLCQVCKSRSAYVRCDSHDKFICHGCDCSLYNDKSQHHKRMVGSYMGSPSAKDFAFLWGFEMNKLENFGLEVPKYRFGKQVRGRLVSSKIGIESEVGPSSHDSEVYCKDSQNINTCTILQQIIELEKFQLNEAKNMSSFIRTKATKQQSNSSASIYDTSWKLNKSLPHPLSIAVDSNEEMAMDTFTSSFSPLEDLTSSSTVGDSLQGEPFWECERRDHDFEMWSENIQELGICEESALFDNSSIPEVDVSFQDFEEFFECDKKNTNTTLLDKKEMSTSSMENNMASLCKGDRSYTKKIEDDLTLSCMEKHIGLHDQASKVIGKAGCSYPIQTSYSTMSRSLSGLNARTNYKTATFTPLTVRPKEPPSNPSEQIMSAEVEGKGRAPRRYKDKKNARQYKKQSEDQYREERVDARIGECGKF